MRLDIRGSKFRLSRRMRAHVERRAHLVLSRFGTRVVSVQVLLSGEDGPGRGGDRVCRVVVVVRGAGPFAVEHRDAQVERAVDDALDRAARQVARTTERLDRTWTISEGT